MGYTGARITNKGYVYTGAVGSCTYSIDSSTLLDLGSYDIHTTLSLPNLKLLIDKHPIVAAVKVCSTWTGWAAAITKLYETDCTAT